MPFNYHGEAASTYTRLLSHVLFTQDVRWSLDATLNYIETIVSSER
jgi:hypothetical protein